MAKKKKILIFNNSFFDVSQTFIYYQVNSLSKNNDIHLLSKQFLNPHNYDMDGFEKIKINHPGNIYDRLFNKVFSQIFGIYSNINIKSYLKLFSSFRRNNYDAVHAHFGPRGLEILPFARYYGVPLIVSFHGYDASELLKEKRYSEKLPVLFDYASAIIISSWHMFDNLKLGPWKNKVSFIPYGVNSANFTDNNHTKKRDSKRLKILHSGRIVGKKGVPDLIRVFNELSPAYPNVELHLIGDGEELPECNTLVREFGIQEKVSFYGAVPQEKVMSLLQEADIFVLNSRTDRHGDMEGTPVSILEAMSMKKAVVSTNHAGIPYVIKHEKNGLLVSERSNQELKDSIERLILNPDLRVILGEEARKTIEESYTTTVMKKKINEVFEKVV